MCTAKYDYGAWPGFIIPWSVLVYSFYDFFADSITQEEKVKWLHSCFWSVKPINIQVPVAYNSYRISYVYGLDFPNFTTISKFYCVHIIINFIHYIFPSSIDSLHHFEYLSS